MGRDTDDTASRRAPTVAGFDGETMARLFDPSQVMGQALGAVLPPEIAITPGMTILNMGCGPGGWALECALAYRDQEVELLGIDRDVAAIAFARSMAHLQLLTNATFEVGSLTHPLNLPDRSIDLIMGHFLVKDLYANTWPLFLRECRRLLKTGGILLLTEAEGFSTTSQALTSLQRVLFHACFQEGRTFSRDGSTPGMTYRLRSLLQQAGLIKIGTRAWAVELSAGSPLSPLGIRDLERGCTLLKDYVIRMGLISPSRYDELLGQRREDLTASDFLGLGYGLLAWGEQPHRRRQDQGKGALAQEDPLSGALKEEKDRNTLFSQIHSMGRKERRAHLHSTLPLVRSTRQQVAGKIR